MRVAIYARVSTKGKGQDTDNQLHQLRVFAEQHGTLYKEFTDEEPGSKADRVEFKAMLLEAYQKKFDLVVFWRLDGGAGHPKILEGAGWPRGSL